MGDGVRLRDTRDGQEGLTGKLVEGRESGDWTFIPDDPSLQPFTVRAGDVDETCEAKRSLGAFEDLCKLTKGHPGAHRGICLIWGDED